METEHPDPQATRAPVTLLKWEDVWDRLARLSSLIRNSVRVAGQERSIWIYGIPRGGAVVAGLLVAHNPQHFTIADSPGEAEVLVDDILDSGATTTRWHRETGLRVFYLVPDKGPGWVVFPWEERDSTADIADTVVRQLEFIGEDPNREGLRDTPRRVIEALQEMTQGYEQDPKKILATRFRDDYDEMVVVRGIPFTSLCEHHALSFRGTADVGYVPAGQVVGLSKIPRLVHCFAKRLQLQERMTKQIAQALQEELKPMGVGVVVRAVHTCCADRGVRSHNEMVTSCLLGCMREEPEARAEFLALVR